MAFTSMGSRPAAWTASVWKRAPAAHAMPAASATGRTVPVSLFAHMTETSAVSWVTAARRSVRAMEPVPSTGRIVTRQPRRSRSWTSIRVEGCSTAVVTRWRRAGAASDRARSVPRMAVWLASVALAVKRISADAAPIRPATRPRASPTACLAAMPRACGLDGLPYRSNRCGSMASRTSGTSGVVALLSR